jgi:hypothetical protein
MKIIPPPSGWHRLLLMSWCVAPSYIISGLQPDYFQPLIKIKKHTDEDKNRRSGKVFK